MTIEAIISSISTLVTLLATTFATTYAAAIAFQYLIKANNNHKTLARFRRRRRKIGNALNEVEREMETKLKPLLAELKGCIGLKVGVGRPEEGGTYLNRLNQDATDDEETDTNVLVDSAYNSGSTTTTTALDAAASDDSNASLLLGNAYLPNESLPAPSPDALHSFQKKCKRTKPVSLPVRTLSAVGVVNTEKLLSPKCSRHGDRDMWEARLRYSGQTPYGFHILTKACSLTKTESRTQNTMLKKQCKSRTSSAYHSRVSLSKSALTLSESKASPSASTAYQLPKQLLELEGHLARLLELVQSIEPQNMRADFFPDNNSKSSDNSLTRDLASYTGPNQLPSSSAVQAASPSLLPNSSTQSSSTTISASFWFIDVNTLDTATMKAINMSVATFLSQKRAIISRLQYMMHNQERLRRRLVVVEAEHLVPIPLFWETEADILGQEFLAGSVMVRRFLFPLE
jgi:hypothetical protein